MKTSDTFRNLEFVPGVHNLSGVGSRIRIDVIEMRKVRRILGRSDLHLLDLDSRREGVFLLRRPFLFLLAFVCHVRLSFPLWPPAT